MSAINSNILPNQIINLNSITNNFNFAPLQNDLHNVDEALRFQDGLPQRQSIDELQKEETSFSPPKPSFPYLELLEEFNDAIAKVPDNHPVNLFATVSVNGEVVAEVFQSGFTQEFVNIDLPDEPAFGKTLAQTRLDALLEETGGEVTYSNLTSAEIAAQISAYEPPRYVHPSLVNIEEKYNAIQNGTSSLSDYEQESIRQIYEDGRYQKYF